MSRTENGLLKFITCGSVDDGKSTLIGHILYDSKLLYADQEQALLLDSQVGSRGGKIDYSLLLDGLMAEREQGITIDVAYRYFTTDARSFIAADTPGHEEYTRNMAVGASFADLAVILLDASQGVLVQTRRHARICALMGIRYFVFAVNKMDLIDYRQDRFEKIVADIQKLSAELSLENVVVIPVSATEGDNVTHPSANMIWYTGPTLLHYLETVDTAASTPEIGFYLPVQRVCRPDHTFRGFQGQIEAGTVSVGDSVTALPSGQDAVVKGIFIANQPADTASEGQPVTVQLDREVDVSRGCVLAKNAQLKIATAFSASLLWMDDDALLPGREYWVKLGTKLLTCVVSEVQYKIDINSGARLPAQKISKNEIVRCEIVLSQPTVLDQFADHKTMGSLILIDRVTHATSACGVVERVDTGDDKGVAFEQENKRASLSIFDEFYYHLELNTIIRHSTKKAVYRPGDVLPLKTRAYEYPDNFDILSETEILKVRDGKFAGFGVRDEGVPLLDSHGLALQAGDPIGRFETYRRIPVWEGGHEI